MTDTDAASKQSYYCTHCEVKNWVADPGDSVECSDCGREFSVSHYGPFERLRDNILDANGLLGGETDA